MQQSLGWKKGDILGLLQVGRRPLIAPPHDTEIKPTIPGKQPLRERAMAMLGQKGLSRHNFGGLRRKKQQNQAGRE